VDAIVKGVGKYVYDNAEMLARMAARAQPDASLTRFAVESLEPATLPELRAGDLPRFEAKRLEVRTYTNEGSGS